MSKVRNRYELELMRKSGNIAKATLKKALEGVKIGVSELEVDDIAKEEVYRLGGDLSYKSIPNYKFATCITVNDQVVHGIPTTRKFAAGDIVSVDLAVEFRGWHTDCAWSILLGKDPEKQKFLRVGEQALWDAISNAIEGHHIGDISYAIQNKVEGEGYHVVRSLVGHGIGRDLHEEPEVPGYGERGSGIKLVCGMTLAIEVIYGQGTSDVVLEKDGWTFKMADGSCAGLFEMTVVVGEDKAEVLTAL